MTILGSCISEKTASYTWAFSVTMSNLKTKANGTIERTCCVEMKLEWWVDHAFLLFIRLERSDAHWPRIAWPVHPINAVHWRHWQQWVHFSLLMELILPLWSRSGERGRKGTLFVSTAILHFRYTAFIAIQLAMIAAADIYISNTSLRRINYNLIYPLLRYISSVIKLYMILLWDTVAKPSPCAPIMQLILQLVQPNEYTLNMEACMNSLLLW